MIRVLKKMIVIFAGFCWLFFSFQIFSSEILEKVEENDAFSKRKLKIAICYWGLTRSTKIVYPSHYEHLFNLLQNNNIQYEIFMHTWFIGNEGQNIQKEFINISPDYEEYKFLNPSYYRIDNQEEFKRSSSLLQSVPTTNTIMVNYICALESQKRVTDMVLQNGSRYDLVMYVRPDVLLKNPFPVEMLYKLGEKDILIPNFHHWGGYNDRFAVLNYKDAPIYGKRIESVLEYVKKAKKLHAETYLKYICNKNHLNVLLINFKFDRVRPDGKIR